MSKLTLLAPGALGTSTGAATLVIIPLDSSGGNPRFVRVSSTASAYIKAGDVNVVAAVGDLMIQPGDATLINVSGCDFISVKSVTGTAYLNIQPTEHGRWNYGGPNVLDLFRAGGQGALWDFSDMATLYQDSAGTQPVTAYGQPVGRVTDKSGKGNTLIQPTAINRPIYALDANGKPSLSFNGTNQWLSTAANLGLSGTDKVTVVAGVRKLSDASGFPVFLELGTSPRTLSIYQNAGAGGDKYTTSVFGSQDSWGAAGPTLPAPATSILTVSADIVAASRAAAIRQRINQVDYALTGGSNVAPSGSNFGNYPLYIGARAGSSLFFNGNLHTLCIRGALSTQPEIDLLERFANSRAGAYA